MGAWEAASHGAARYGHGRPQVVPGKAADAPAGRVMLTVGKLDARQIHHALDLEAAA